MSDLISRKAAIDAVNAYLGLSAVSRTIQNMTSIQEILENLPSAEPKTPSNGSITSINPENTHDRTMGDCISRKDAIKSMANAIWHYPNELYTGLNSYEMSEALAKDGLMFLPSAEPEIIRCRDCKYSQMIDDGECRFCKIWFAEEDHFLPGDYYCADAERKDNG